MDFNTQRNKKNDVSKKQTKQEILQQYTTNNDMANKCLRIFFDAIQENLEGGDNHRIASVASNIINSLLKNNLLNDKNLLKSKVLNLKDKNNKSLCKNVYEGSISAEKFVFMSIDEMKSEELKKIESNMQKNILLEMQIPQIKGETDMFQCGKCGKRECSYRQLQTRSADEPMTTFVTCVCGHRWKF